MDRQIPAPIATLTLNPALDVTYEIPHLVADQKVGAFKTRFDPGATGSMWDEPLNSLTPQLRTAAFWQERSVCWWNGC